MADSKKKTKATAQQKTKKDAEAPKKAKAVAPKKEAATAKAKEIKAPKAEPKKPAPAKAEPAAKKAAKKEKEKEKAKPTPVDIALEEYKGVLTEHLMEQLREKITKAKLTDPDQEESVDYIILRPIERGAAGRWRSVVAAKHSDTPTSTMGWERTYSSARPSECDARFPYPTYVLLRSTLLGSKGVSQIEMCGEHCEEHRVRHGQRLIHSRAG